MTEDTIFSNCPTCETVCADRYFSFQEHELMRCLACGTVYVHPLPTLADIRKMYDDAYDGATAGYFSKIDKKLRRSRGRVRALARYKPRGRLLDIGCNGGFLVEAARQAGFLATGIDIDPVSIAFAVKHYPGNTFFIGNVEEYSDLKPGTFDIIYTSEVIEHVPNVRDFIKATAILLRSGGILYITTPDISHWRVKRDVRRWDGFNPPAHCVYFTPHSLIRLLGEFGFALVRHRWAFKPGIKLICRKTA